MKISQLADALLDRSPLKTGSSQAGQTGFDVFTKFSIGSLVGKGSSCETFTLLDRDTQKTANTLLFRCPREIPDSLDEFEFKHECVLERLGLPTDHSGPIEGAKLAKVMKGLNREWNEYFIEPKDQHLHQKLPHVYGESSALGAIEGKVGSFVKRVDGYRSLETICDRDFDGSENHALIVRNLAGLMRDYVEACKAMHSRNVMHTDLEANLGIVGELEGIDPPKLAIVDVISIQNSEGDDDWVSCFDAGVRGNFLAMFYSLSDIDVCDDRTENLECFYRKQAAELRKMSEDYESSNPASYMTEFDNFASRLTSKFPS